jgi:hypothetical protein
VFCPACGKQIEADARFCRFCGKPQDVPVAVPVPAGRSSAVKRTDRESGIAAGIKRIFPRHHLQDQIMHLGTIAAFVLAVAGFVLGLFYSVAYLGQTALLFSIALFLFLILRESTLSHVRSRRHSDGAGDSRYHAQRTDPPAESPPPTSLPQA